MYKEQRAYKRRIPERNVYAALGCDYEKVGRIIDLSPGGLAFEYIFDENENAQFSQINIFKVGEVFHLRNLPCKIIYDIALPPPRNGIESLKHSRSRKCGVEFETLPEEDNLQLSLFLKLHTKADH